MVGVALESGRHVMPIRVYYEDTDAAKMVYHSVYLNYAERARTELIRAIGGDHNRLRDEFGVVFVVSRCDLHFQRPARLDDLIEVRTTLTKLGGATLDMSQNIWRGQDELVRLNVTLACINQQGRPVRMPRQVHRRLAEWGGAAQRKR